jgi:hypothetical protein
MPNGNKTPKRNPLAHNNLCAASIHSRKQKEDADTAYANYQLEMLCANR